MGAAIAPGISETLVISENAMADTIEAIVDRAIEHTRTILESARAEWRVARKGLETIHDNLAAGAAGHPALDRLKAFIADQDRARREH
jgi:hypothetical protein